MRLISHIILKIAREKTKETIPFLTSDFKILSKFQLRSLRSFDSSLCESRFMSSKNTMAEKDICLHKFQGTSGHNTIKDITFSSCNDNLQAE